MSKWREIYRVHPATECWPMMPESELQELAADIKANGLQVPIIYYFAASGEKTVIDGRNRLEAMERAGIEPRECNFSCIGSGDDTEVVSKVIGLNAHRRHLTKEIKADLIVAAHKAAAKLNRASDGPVSEKGGRGKTNTIKQDAIATAKDHGISERTIKRSLAKAEGKRPAPPKPKPKRTQSEPLNSFAWSEASLEQRAKWVDAVSVKSIWEAMPHDHRDRLVGFAVAEEGRTGIKANGLDARREGYAEELAKLNMTKVALEIELLKARVGELKGITAPKGAATDRRQA